MNAAAYALKNRTAMVVMTIFLVGAGLLAYTNLGQLEDPTFTIKTALVVTSYPGASPLEVEQEVTDVMEEAIQSMDQVEKLESRSLEGVSYIYVDILDTYTHEDLPQIWDELRRKVGDAQGQLPPGAGPSVVNDDFGDVYGVLFAVTGKGYSLAELKDYAEDLKTELLLCENVAKIDLWGTQQEVIYVEMERARMAELGVAPAQIYQTLQSQNLVQQSGKAEVDGDYLRITPTGEFTSVELISGLLLGSDPLVRLGDVAHIHRGFMEPMSKAMYFNGQPAIGLGISTMDGGNVVEMGDAVRERLEELAPARPLGMDLEPIYYQSEIVTESVSLFMTNLIEAVAIVVILLMLFMGLRSGLLIGFILILTILATFLGMLVMDIDLQKISLGALILALGMLVDNAIVVADSMLVRIQRGEKREDAAIATVSETAWPLLGATVVAILAFMAIGFSPGSVGEYCRSLFYVLAMSLSFSWILAITITPLLCVRFLKPGDTATDPYGSRFYRFYRALLHRTLKLRWVVLAGAVAILVLSMIGFQIIPKAFFPDSTQRRFYVNYWKPESTHIHRTTAELLQAEAFVRTLDGVDNVTTLVGQNTLRFVLSYNIEPVNSSYGQLIVDVEDYREIGKLMNQVEAYLAEHFPDSEPYCSRVPNGPAVSMKVEARFRGPDIAVLKELAAQAMDIMRANPGARDIRTDWRQNVQVIRPVFSESQARRVGVTRNDVAQAMQFNFNGVTAGLYREADQLLPIIARAPARERQSLDSLADIQVWSSLKNGFVPIGQVISGVERKWESPIIRRLDRQRAVNAQCNPVDGLAEPLRQELIPAIEAIPLPLGYTLEWGGEIEESTTAQNDINRTFPLCLLGMFLVVVWLFNSVRRPLMIFVILPLAIIGVFLGLALTGLPFGFMAILGFLGLSGMMIKNAIVLIDQIDLDISAGKDGYRAVLDSGVSRLRPVVMAAGTTVLGMAPLVTDPLYAGMAATIMGGLLVATMLTLLIVPVLYCLFFRISPSDSAL